MKQKKHSSSHFLMLDPDFFSICSLVPSNSFPIPANFVTLGENLKNLWKTYRNPRNLGEKPAKLGETKENFGENRKNFSKTKTVRHLLWSCLMVEPPISSLYYSIAILAYKWNNHNYFFLKFIFILSWIKYL